MLVFLYLCFVQLILPKEQVSCFIKIAKESNSNYVFFKITVRPIHSADSHNYYKRNVTPSHDVSVKISLFNLLILK